MSSETEPLEHELERRQRAKRWLRAAAVAALGLVIVSSGVEFVDCGNRRVERAENERNALRAEVEQYKLALNQIAEQRAQDHRDWEFARWFGTPLSGEVGRVNNRWVGWVWFEGDVNLFLQWVRYSLEGNPTSITKHDRDDGFCAAIDVDELVRSRLPGRIEAFVHSNDNANLEVAFHLGRTSYRGSVGQGTDYLEVASATADDYVALAGEISGLGVRVFERVASADSHEPKKYALALGPASGNDMTNLVESWSYVIAGLRARGVKGYSDGRVVPGVQYSNSVYPVSRCEPP